MSSRFVGSTSDIASRLTLGMFAAIGDLSSNRIWAIVLGVLLAAVAIALLVASWTKWGQTKSLTKCIALAFLAHVWLLMYAYGTRIVTPGFGGGNQGGIRNDNGAITMTLMEALPAIEAPSASPPETGSEQESTDDPPTNEYQIAAWEAPLHRNQPDQEERSVSTATETPKTPEFPVPEVRSTPVIHLAASNTPEPDLPPMESAEQIAMLAAPPNPASDMLPSQLQAPPQPTTPQLSGQPPELSGPPPELSGHPPELSGHPMDRSKAIAESAATQTRKVDHQSVPIHYQMRLSPQRQQYAMLNGGDVDTESAVERALAWLARSQGIDGGWHAAEHGAGRVPSAANNRTHSEYRHNAGLKANTAMTGLALLAFLGAGHTHVDGQYKEVVTRGLLYLKDQQLPSGDLSGRDQVGREPTVRFARMYSHGMAALALTEAYGMTGDPVLLATVQSACKYTLGAMNPRTGGWRYEFPTDDPGDMSQFGWQAMLLKSAANHQAISLAPQTRMVMQRFLDSVSTGRHGGLGIYRPKAGQMPASEQATPAMTAELLASRLLLSFPITPLAAEEGQRMILKNLPGKSEENLYYWYYATLAMYQLRGDGELDSQSQLLWNQWNDSLKQQLCSTQVPRGQEEGSWNPSCLWGGYGGRVYSTAVACMCLEVYYRYLPMYKTDHFAAQWQPASLR